MRKQKQNYPINSSHQLKKYGDSAVRAIIIVGSIAVTASYQFAYDRHFRTQAVHYLFHDTHWVQPSVMTKITRSNNTTTLHYSLNCGGYSNCSTLHAWNNQIRELIINEENKILSTPIPPLLSLLLYQIAFVFCAARKQNKTGLFAKRAIAGTGLALAITATANLLCLLELLISDFTCKANENLACQFLNNNSIHSDAINQGINHQFESLKNETFSLHLFNNPMVDIGVFQGWQCGMVIATIMYVNHRLSSRNEKAFKQNSEETAYQRLQKQPKNQKMQFSMS